MFWRLCGDGIGGILVQYEYHNMALMVDGRVDGQDLLEDLSPRDTSGVD